MISASKSITGKRAQNEDSVFSGDCGDLFVYAVADGMGGRRAGEIASKCVIDQFKQMASQLNSSSNIDNVLLSASDSANTEVYNLSLENSSYFGMGSTLTACILDDVTVSVLNVGDSRLYHIHGNEIEQITHDHSYVYALVEAGIITEKEALTHPKRNEITKALGVEKYVTPDIYHFYWDPGDYLLLCTDGVSGTLLKEDLMALFRSSEPVDILVDRIVDLAYEKGSKDNISAIVVQNTEVVK